MRQDHAPMPDPIPAAPHAASPSKLSMFGPILGSHLERIGFIRTIAGGGPMYLCIPMLIMLHTTLAVVLYQWLVRPLLGTPRVRWADYVIIDRHRISELTWFDKLNCVFCGYANGVNTMINQELDYAADLNAPVALWKRPLLTILCLAYLPIYVIFELNFQIIYNILVSRPLGMHRVSMKEALTVLKRQRYAAAHGVMFRAWLYLTKSCALRFVMALEQIESSWCPLRHFERRKGVVYPEHHKKFFGPDEVKQMREVLRTSGTVSARKPTY